jgi:hypothetical protein
MSSPRLLFYFFFVTPMTIAFVHAQCPVNTVMVRGRVDNPPANAKVQVHLLYSKQQPGESAEATLEGDSFRIPVEFLTQSSKPLLANLHAKCDRKPKTVVVTLLSGDQQSAQVSLDLLKDFDHLDASAYTTRQEIILQHQH